MQLHPQLWFSEKLALCGRCISGEFLLVLDGVTNQTLYPRQYQCSCRANPSGSLPDTKPCGAGSNTIRRSSRIGSKTTRLSDIEAHPRVHYISWRQDAFEPLLCTYCVQIDGNVPFHFILLELPKFRRKK